MKRRLLAFLLALSMMFSLVPVNAFAVGTAEAGNTAPSEVAETEAAAETPVAEYAAQAEPAVTVGFTRYEESPANLGVGDQFGDAFTFAVSEDVSFETFEATFRYDPTVAMFGLFSPTEFDVEPNHETGVLTIRDANKTFAAGQSYSYVLLFAGAQLGDATVMLESFKIDGKELLSKSIDAVQTVGYNVSWAENAAYTITGERYAPVGGSYTFTVDVSDGYDAANMVVKANGEEVTGTGNQYTVDPVSSDLTITVEGVTEKKDPVFTISLTMDEDEKENVSIVPDADVYVTDWIKFTLDKEAEFKLLEMKFKFNPDTMEIHHVIPQGLSWDLDAEAGTLGLYIGDKTGEATTTMPVMDYAYFLGFTPKALGDATVTLEAFEVDGRNVLEKPLSVTRTIGYKVNWTEDAAYTVTGEKYAAVDGTYTFTVAAKEGYDASKAVVKVNGTEVAAVDGKYTVENVASDLTITVEGVTEAVKKPGLSVLKFGDTSTESKAKMFELSPAFDPAVKEYTVLVPDNANMFYAWATQAADRSSSTTITAKWVNLNIDTEKTQKLTSGKAGGQNLAGFAPTGVKVNTMTIEVVDGDFKDEYKLTSVRVAPSLTALSLDGIRLAESFSATKMAYTATTAAESVTVAATPRDESYTVTINGGSETTVPLNLGENEIKIVVTNPGGYTNTYTITVTRVASVEAVFNVDPADAKVIVWDANKDRVVPTDGKYSVMSGAEYTYLVQRDGYVSQKSSFTFTESGSIIVTLVQATENPSLDKSIRAEWGNFRKGDNNLGITDARTPYAPEDAELLWAVKHGTGWSAAPGSPIMVDGDIYTYSGSTIRRLNSMTGETVTEGTMVGSSNFSIVPMTYGDGMVFVGLSDGRIQAFNAKTLESLWVYTDELGGQPNCPITYKDGYIYAGFWNSEDRNANFACINTIDEDHASGTEAKYASWTYTRQGGFYWAGAYVTDKLAIVGTDDGAGGYDTNGAALLVFDRYTGALIDSHEGIRGDLRSNISHDPESDRVFFTTKGGILGNAQIDWDTGKILDYKEAVITNSKGTANAMSTCTPSVYNGRIYIGVSGDSQFGANSGHGIAVYTLNGDGSMTQAYVYPIIGYPQTSAMVSTAYSAEDGYVYIYLPYNYTPGGISVLKDRPGQTAPITTTGEGYSEVFTPVGTLAQYCICSTIADQYGTIYYKNDSCYMMAITSKIESLEITQEPTITENEDGTLTVDGLKAVTKLRNGLERDVSNYVSVTKNEQTGGYTVSYTYGFDNDSYGLKTVTAEITNGYTVTIPEDDGYTVTGEKTVKDGENYTFTVTVAEGYDGTGMVVKVNGEEVKPVDGVYTVEKVSSNLEITVEGVTKKVAYTLNFEGMSGAGDNVAKGAAFEGVFSVTADSAVSYETFVATFKFDPTVVEVTYVRPAIFQQSIDTEKGILTLTSQKGSFPANVKAEIMIGFKSIAFGDATVSLTSVKADEKEVLPEAITLAKASGYKVTWTDDAAYTVTGEKYADVNGTYTFTVAANKGYDASNAVVKVNDTEVTAVDGKYTVENVTSDLTITVEGVVKAAVNGLSALRFGSTGTNSSAKIFTLSPAFDPAVKEYTLLVPDSTNAVYAWATRGADLTTKATIKATWTSMSTGKASNTTLTSGNSSGKNLSGFNIASAESNTLTITVTEGDVTDVYTVKTVRIDPSLTKLALDGVKINENFSATKKTYTAITTKDSVTVLATPRGESYTITYNGETSNVVPLTNGENKIEIVVTNKDGYTNSYTLTVTKAEHSVTIPTDESYLVTGKEAVVDGDDYTFKVEIDYRYELDDDFAVKVNGETVTGEKGVYTVKNVTTDLVITVEGLKWKVLEPVTVYFSFSHDEKYQFCEQSGQVVALKEITVPYFDLALYGLEDFYFASENYGPASGDPTGGPGSALDPGTKEFAYGKITMLHLFLYATEVYYLGVDPADAGKGYMRDQIGSDTLTFSGSAGSIYMPQIWGYDENLNYYLNYAYPLASEGWGSTSDQILLHDGDIVTLGHFSDWGFYSDTGAVFNHIETDITDPVQGDKVKMTIYRDGADFGGTYNTAHTVRTNCPSVYCTPADSVTTGDVTKWKYVGTAEADGTLVVDTSSLAPGEYIFSIPGQYGNENESAIVGAPGGIRLTIHEKTVTVIKGDINGDGVINAFDVTELYNAVSSGKELDTALADINGDGVVNALDVAALFALIQSGN